MYRLAAQGFGSSAPGPHSVRANSLWLLALATMPFYNPISSSSNILKSKTLIVVRRYLLAKIVLNVTVSHLRSLAYSLGRQYLSVGCWPPNCNIRPVFDRHFWSKRFDPSHWFERKWRRRRDNSIRTYVLRPASLAMRAHLSMYEVYGKEGLDIVIMQQRSPALKVRLSFSPLHADCIGYSGSEGVICTIDIDFRPGVWTWVITIPFGRRFNKPNWLANAVRFFMNS